MSIWEDATVLVTGGTGWFGRAFVEHALSHLKVRSIRVVSRDEHKQHAMRQRWPDTGPDSRIRYLVGDVRDRDRLTRAMHGVDLCVHAAALKRVEGSSTHARELLKTNTLGTANVIDAALDCGVRRTIFLSSDKAALATNAYGKSKALAEDLIIEGNTLAGGRDVRFSAVKYGNILGSTGSVLHLWDAAVAAGRPIPLTDERMTRFYMPVNRAVGLVAWAVGFMRGGEIFSADMPRVRLLDLLRVAHPDHPYRVLGERPGGEKLHETLIGEDEARHATEIPGRFIIWPQQPDWDAHYTRIGVPLPEGYALTSNTPPFAGATQIQTLLDEAGYTPLTTQTEERRVA